VVLRRFAIIGQKATASHDFILDDLPGTSGRLDILVRCLRPALLASHGIRRNVVVYLVLLGGPRAPRVIRIDGSLVRFIRPDERSLAVLAKKILERGRDADTPGFAPIRPGIAIASGALEVVLADSVGATPYVLEEGALDIREAEGLGATDALFVVGDHLGVPEESRAMLDAIGARPIAIGPVSVHADDVVSVLTNELDRRTGAAEGQ
jgi:tRNA (pseudouridine54-N1)-methyltransferase